MDLVEALESVLGRGRVKHHPLDLLVFAKDAGITAGPVAAVVLPESTEEVAACVRVAGDMGVPVIARGAGTGLAGGAVPVVPSLLVVLTRMNEVMDVDPVGRTAWVGPGLINLDLSRRLAPIRLHFAPDPSSQQSCTVGGNVATNAGGPHCLAEGTTTAHVLAVELVTADGDAVVLGSEAPDPIGLDLRAAVVGSEGTVGIVTRVLVKLTQTPPAVRTVLLGFPDVAGASETVTDVIGGGLIPAALEMMDRPMVRAVENFVHAGYPLDCGAVLLAELVGLEAGVIAEARIVESIARRRGATVVRIAEDDEERALLWKGRKSAFGAIAQNAPDYYLHDTVVPRTRLTEVMTQVYEIADRYGLDLMNVFHAGDGNLHPLVSFDADEPGMLDRVMAAAKEMVRVSVEAGGALTGEHGVGIEKRNLMRSVFSELDLDAQARLRDAFDPGGLMNPGKVLPEGSRCFDRAPGAFAEAM
jgi:glycolate dehydrogenase FAD-linked subunit